MDTLPPEIITQLLPDARGVVAIKNTCRRFFNYVAERVAGGTIATTAYTIVRTSDPANIIVLAGGPIRRHLWECHDETVVKYVEAFDNGVIYIVEPDYVAAVMLMATPRAGVIHKMRQLPRSGRTRADIRLLFNRVGYNGIKCRDGRNMKATVVGTSHYTYELDGITLCTGNKLLVGPAISDHLVARRTSSVDGILQLLPDFGGAYATEAIL